MCSAILLFSTLTLLVNMMCVYSIKTLVGSSLIHGLIYFGAYFIGSLIAYPLLLQASANFTKCFIENSTPNSEFSRIAISGPLTLTLEPSSKVESLFLNGESLILVLNIIKFSVGEDEIVKCLIGPLGSS